MKRLERMELISQIGRELQARMTQNDINVYLSGFNINTKKETSNTNSKWVYVKELLADESDSTILKIADELNIQHSFEIIDFSPTNADFWRPNYFKLFISHLSTYKDKIHLLKIALEKYGISSFVAHDDIEPTREWQNEIEKALFTMDALAAIIMPGFKESNWTDQEIGIALGRNKLIIPIRKGLDPYGFVAKYQGFNSNGKSVDEVAEGIFSICVKNKKTQANIIESLSNIIINSNKKDILINLLNLLEKYNDISFDVLIKVKDFYQNNPLIINDSEINKILFKLFKMNSIEIDIAQKDKAIQYEDVPF